MTGNQIAVILDTGLPLDNGKAQIAEGAHGRAQQAIQQGNQVIDFKFQEKVQNQRINQHTQHGSAQAAEDPLNGLIGADHRSQLVLAEAQADEIRAGIVHECHNKGNQNHISSHIHGQNPNQRRQKIRNHHAAHKAHAHGFKAHLNVIAHHFRQHQHEEGHEQQHKIGSCRLKIAPHGNGEGHDGGINHKPGLLHKSRPVQ